MGYLKHAIGGFTAGLWAVAFFPSSAVLVPMFGHNPTLVNANFINDEKLDADY